MRTEHQTRAQSPAKVLLLVYLVYLVMCADKSVIAVLAEPFRQRFGLNDEQLGMLSGLGYAVPFIVASLPMGRLVDRTPRKTVLAILLAAWSLLTGAGAFAHSYVALLLSRGGVGLVEAGGPPAMLSILTDTFDRHQRPRAIGIYYTGAPLGAVLGAAIGSLAAGHWGWQNALLAAGAPGLILVVVIAWGLREPVRGRFDTAAAAHQSGTWRDALRFLTGHARCRSIMCAMTLTSASIFSLSYWITPLLMRNYGLNIQSAGTIGPLGVGLAGAVGSLAGGMVVSRYLAAKPEHQLILCAVAVLVAAPMLLMQFATSLVAVTMTGFALSALFNAVCFGPSYSLCLSYAPLPVRATVASFIMLLTNLMGGVGSSAVGMLSDALAHAGYKDSLGLALASAGFLSLMAAAFYVRAARSDDTLQRLTARSYVKRL